ncbi:class IIb bacteriocin, lactobin A/cerein 7B family [Lactococcus cremoris]|nr:class IIb bacteriocin, lactobin A/cerein 7B family [Lactococcus cremoris]
MGDFSRSAHQLKCPKRVQIGLESVFLWKDKRFFEVFETLTNAELMGISGGGGLINYSQNYLSSVLIGSGDIIGDIYDR